MCYYAKGYKKGSGKEQDSAITRNYGQALHDAMCMLNSDQYKAIVILSDSEGADHPDNDGKFFLCRIIK